MPEQDKIPKVPTLEERPLAWCFNCQQKVTLTIDWACRRCNKRDIQAVSK